MSRNFQVVMLASGSRGNSALISTESQRFLVDVGLSCRELVRRLREAGAAPEELEGVFITHEHIDHIKGLAVFARKYSVPLYASAGTWRAVCQKYPEFDPSRCLLADGTLLCGDVQVRSFAVPHDAAEPCGYSFVRRSTGCKCTYVTDAGFVTPLVREAAAGSGVLVLEANHDVEMLKQGSYPYELKQRILSTRGHLANVTAGMLLARLPQLPQQVILAHLSEQNNRPQLALATVAEILQKQGRLQETELLTAAQDHIVANALTQMPCLF